MFTYVSIGWNGYSAIVINEAMPISYEDLVSCVGGYIEGVYLDGATAWVNEEGKLQDLPKNYVATDLAHAHNAIHTDDWIAGNMIIVGNSDDEGEMTSLTNEWINNNLKEIANV